MNIILGTLNFDYDNVSETFNQQKINSMLNLAHSHNINTIDTAYYYGNTQSLLGHSNLLHLFNVNSKANPWHNNDFSNGIFGELNNKGITSQLLQSLDSLGIDSLNTYFLHSWDYHTPINDTLFTFDEFYRKELFNSFGVSNISPPQLFTILEFCENNNLNLSPTVYQGMYNLYCRKIEELFTTFSDHNIDFQCYNPLAGGLLTGKYFNKIHNKGRFVNNPIYNSIFWNDTVVKNTQHLTTDISLRWLTHHSKLRQNDSIIIGCSSENQLQLNMSSLSSNIPLSSTDLNTVNTFYSISNSFQPNYFY